MRLDVHLPLRLSRGKFSCQKKVLGRPAAAEACGEPPRRDAEQPEHLPRFSQQEPLIEVGQKLGAQAQPTTLGLAR